MTSDIALIALGTILQVTTFVIGILVGRVSRRERDDNGNSNEAELPTRWRHDGDRNTATGTRGRVGSSANTVAETGAYERALREWRDHGD